MTVLILALCTGLITVFVLESLVTEQSDAFHVSVQPVRLYVVFVLPRTASVPISSDVSVGKM